MSIRKMADNITLRTAWATADELIAAIEANATTAYPIAPAALIIEPGQWLLAMAGKYDA